MEEFQNYRDEWFEENDNPPKYNEVIPGFVIPPNTATSCMICLSNDHLSSVYKDDLSYTLCERCKTRKDIVLKTWGFEQWFAHTELYCGKILGVMPERYCSMHYHKLKDETFFVQSGIIQLTYSENGGDGYKLGYLYPGMSFRIPRGMWHKFMGVERSIIIETSTPHLESDSYRITPSIKGHPTRYT